MHVVCGLFVPELRLQLMEVQVGTEIKHQQMIVGVSNVSHQLWKEVMRIYFIAYFEDLFVL